MIIDFDRQGERQMILDKLKELRGRQRVSITKYRPRRSDRQNRYYFPCFVKVFGEYLREQGNDHVSDEDVHEFFKAKFLTRTFADPKTGKLYNLPVSTTTLTTTEFNEYLDKIAAFLAMDFGIVVPEPSVYREPPERFDYGSMI